MQSETVMVAVIISELDEICNRFGGPKRRCYVDRRYPANYMGAQAQAFRATGKLFLLFFAIYIHYCIYPSSLLFFLPSYHGIIFIKCSVGFSDHK